MTNREKAIVMAYTGVCMLSGVKFQIFHKYVEDIMHRPIMTHELVRYEDAIKEKSKDDFIALCEDQTSCDDVISRESAINAVSDLLYHVAIEHDDIAKKTINKLPSVTLQPKAGYISIDDVMSVFDDYMCGEVDEDDKDTFLNMLKDKSESED